MLQALLATDAKALSTADLACKQHALWRWIRAYEEAGRPVSVEAYQRHREMSVALLRRPNGIVRLSDQELVELEFVNPLTKQEGKSLVELKAFHNNQTPVSLIPHGMYGGDRPPIKTWFSVDEDPTRDGLLRHRCTKDKNSEAIMLGWFRPGTGRAKGVTRNNMAFISGLGQDADKAITSIGTKETLDALCDHLESLGLAYVLWETYSSGQPKYYDTKRVQYEKQVSFRLVLPLSAPMHPNLSEVLADKVLGHELPALVNARRLAQDGSVAYEPPAPDKWRPGYNGASRGTASRNPESAWDYRTRIGSQLWFLPGHLPGKSAGALLQNTGKPLNLEEVLSRPDLKLDESEQRRTEARVYSAPRTTTAAPGNKFDERALANLASKHLEGFCTAVEWRDEGLYRLVGQGTFYYGRYIAAGLLDWDETFDAIEAALQRRKDHGLGDTYTTEQRLTQIETALNDGVEAGAAYPTRLPNDLESHLAANRHTEKDHIVTGPESARLVAQIAKQTLGEDETAVIDITTGGGKSHATALEVVPSVVAEGGRVVLAAPMHKNLHEYKKKLPLLQPGQVVHMRTPAVDAGDGTVCRRIKEEPSLALVLAMGTSFKRAVCQAKKRCPYLETCEAFRQSEEAVAGRKASDVVLVSHAGIGQAAATSDLEDDLDKIGRALLVDEMPETHTRMEVTFDDAQELVEASWGEKLVCGRWEALVGHELALEMLHSPEWTGDVASRHALIEEPLRSRLYSKEPFEGQEGRTWWDKLVEFGTSVHTITLQKEKVQLRESNHQDRLTQTCKKLVEIDVAKQRGHRVTDTQNGLVAYIPTPAGGALACAKSGAVLLSATPDLIETNRLGYTHHRVIVKDASPTKRKMLYRNGSGIKHARVGAAAGSGFVVDLRRAVVLARLERAKLEGQVPDNERILVVTFKVAEEYMRRHPKEFGGLEGLELAHFGAVEGLNDWEQTASKPCCVSLVFGDHNARSLSKAEEFYGLEGDDKWAYQAQNAASAGAQAHGRLRLPWRTLPSTLIHVGRVPPRDWHTDNTEPLDFEAAWGSAIAAAAEQVQIAEVVLGKARISEAHPGIYRNLRHGRLEEPQYALFDAARFLGRHARIHGLVCALADQHGTTEASRLLDCTPEVLRRARKHQKYVPLEWETKLDETQGDIGLPVELVQRVPGEVGGAETLGVDRAAGGRSPDRGPDPQAVGDVRVGGQAAQPHDGEGVVEAQPTPTHGDPRGGVQGDDAAGRGRAGLVQQAGSGLSRPPRFRSARPRGPDCGPRLEVDGHSQEGRDVVPLHQDRREAPPRPAGDAVRPAGLQDLPGEGRSGALGVRREDDQQDEEATHGTVQCRDRTGSGGRFCVRDSGSGCARDRFVVSHQTEMAGDAEEPGGVLFVRKAVPELSRVQAQPENRAEVQHGKESQRRGFQSGNGCVNQKATTPTSTPSGRYRWTGGPPSKQAPAASASTRGGRWTGGSQGTATSPTERRARQAA